MTKEAVYLTRFLCLLDHVVNDRSQDQLHGHTHLAAGNNNSVTARHERMWNHVEQELEVSVELPRILEADNDEAFIRRWDVTCNERVRCVYRCDTLEVDIGA